MGIIGYYKYPKLFPRGLRAGRAEEVVDGPGRGIFFATKVEVKAAEM
jgi:hypothetical protein